MKNKILYILGLMLLSSLVVFNSCEEKDDYNYDNIEPVIFSISGPNPATAHGNDSYPFEYTVAHRGGSTYNWEIGGDHNGTAVLDEEDPSIAYITFDQSSVNTAATITVTETTAGGKVSEPFSMDVDLLAFCPYPMEDYVGDYTGTAPGNHAPTVEMVAEEGLNVIRAKGLAYFVPNTWGENWVTGDGSAVLEFGCGDVVNIYPQWIGDTDYPDSYGIAGSGTVDTDAKTITLNYDVSYGWSGTSGTVGASISTVLTLDGKILHQEVKVVPNPKK